MSTVMLAISEKMAQWLSTTPSWLQNAPEGIQNIFYQLYQTWIMNDNWHYFTDGLKVTILATLGALVIGVVIGVLIAVIRSAHDSSRKKPPVALRILNALSKLYLTVVRGTPMIVQLLIMCFVVMVPRGQEEFGALPLLLVLTLVHMWQKSFDPGFNPLTRDRWRLAGLWGLIMAKPCDISSSPRPLRISCRLWAMS